MTMLEAVIDLKAAAELAGIPGPLRLELDSLEAGRALEAECSRLGFTRDLRMLRDAPSAPIIHNEMLIAGVRITWPER